MSLLVAFFVDIKCINWILSYGFFSGESYSFMDILYPATVFLIFFISLFGNRRKKRYSFAAIFLIIYLVLFYFITQLFVGVPRVSIPFFLVFTLCSIFIPQISVIDGRLFSKAIMFFPFFGIFRTHQVFLMSFQYVQAGIVMETSYSFLPPIIANIVYLFIYYKQETRTDKLITIILTIINSYYFLQLFTFGSRGPLFAVISVIIFLYIVKPNIRGVKINYRKLSTVTLITVPLIMSIGYLFVKISDIFSDFGIESYAINKIIALNSEGDVSNGRNSLLALSFDGFLDSPLLGNGLDQFYKNTGNFYPHNFIVQTLYDGGLVLFFVLLIPIINGIRKFYKTCMIDGYSAISILLFIFVPYAMFSQDMWEISGLWVFFGAVLSKNFIFEEQNKSIVVSH